MQIGYLTEPVEKYNAMVTDAKSLKDLRTGLSEWRLLADDAYQRAMSMNEREWKPFQTGLKRERRGKFAGEQWSDSFAMILMPIVMFQVSIVAQRFKVPWGCAYIRCVEGDLITVEEGVAVWIGMRP